MKNQHLFFEYLLLIIIVLPIIYFVYRWYISNQSILSGLLSSNQLQNKIKLIDEFLYNTEGLFNSSMEISINANFKCENNFSIIYTDKACGNGYNFTFQGYVINQNGILYLYSNQTGLYYQIARVGSYIYSGCYEFRESYIINSSYCYGYCIENCRLEVGWLNGEIFVKQI